MRTNADDDGGCGDNGDDGDDDDDELEGMIDSLTVRQVSMTITGTALYAWSGLVDVCV